MLALVSRYFYKWPLSKQLWVNNLSQQVRLFALMIKKTSFPSTKVTAHTYRGVPTQRIFWKPNTESISRRKWQLRSANRYCALLFLLSRGQRSRLGLFNRCTVMSSESGLCFAWFAHSPGKINIWQSTQNLLCSSGRDTNSLNLWKKQTHAYMKYSGRSSYLSYFWYCWLKWI